MASWQHVKSTQNIQIKNNYIDGFPNHNAGVLYSDIPVQKTYSAKLPINYCHSGFCWPPWVAVQPRQCF